MENEDTRTRRSDVCIYLVDKVKGPGSRDKKRKRQDDRSIDYGPPKAEVHMDSRKLCRCSKYFEVAMSERWSESETQYIYFYLELETEIMYYTDCFARMNFSFPRPITDAGTCIGLLKVASQIQYEALLNDGMKILATLPWEEWDEKHIRWLSNSGNYIVSCDLKARLESTITREDRQKKCRELTKKTIREVFELAWNPGPRDLELLNSGDGRVADLDNRKLFGEAFSAIMSEKTHVLQEFCIKLIKEGSDRTLKSLANDPCEEVTDHVDIDVTRLLWLYEMTQKGNGSQLIVELLLTTEGVKCSIQNADLDVRIKFAEMLAYIFHDMIDGFLFFTTLERRTLFCTWNWMFTDELMKGCGRWNLVVETLSSFPLVDQEAVFRTWVVDESTERSVSAYYSWWLASLVQRLASPPRRCLGGDDSADEVDFSSDSE